MTNKKAECFLPESNKFEFAFPVSKLNCSRNAGWTSLLVETLDKPANVERFDCPIPPAQAIVVCLKGECEVESVADGSRSKGIYRPGFSSLTPAGKTQQLHIQSKVSERIVMTQIYIPQFFFTAAADEYRRIGTVFRANEPLDGLGFCDPLIFQTALSLNEAIQNGAPNLYAESAAQFLATHLLSLHGKWSESAWDAKRAVTISDRRLRRVLEYMEHRYAENLSVAELAAEAGISRFHFIKLFKEKCGATPYQHLVSLRMKAAAALLQNSDLSVKEIAARCGYENASHLPVVFQKHFGQTPTEYRTNIFAAKASTNGSN